MIEVKEITIEEFKKHVYDKYITLFPEEEQREWYKISNSYKKGVEKFYKISLDNNTVGFFMLEKLKELPYYLDYFAIYKEYQNKGYGTVALKKLLDDIINDNGLFIEIEKVDDKNIITKKRLRFYESLGFKKINSEYSLYNVLYNPVVYYNENNKKKIDEIFFKYYEFNVGTKDLIKHCKIIK